MVPTINSVHALPEIPNAQLIIYQIPGMGPLFQFPELFVTHATIFLDGPFAGTGPLTAAGRFSPLEAVAGGQA